MRFHMMPGRSVCLHRIIYCGDLFCCLPRPGLLTHWAVVVVVIGLLFVSAFDSTHV